MEENNRSESQITNPANTNVQIVSVQGNPGEGFGIASLITALLGLSIIPVILGFIGLSKSKKISQKNGPALAGVIIGFISFFIKIVIILGIITISYSSYELMKKDVPISRPGIDGIELPIVRPEKDQLTCDETSYPKIHSLAQDERYKLYVNGDIIGEGPFAYASSGSDLLICDGDTNQLIKSITILDNISIMPGPIDRSSSDYILLDAGTDITRSKTLVKVQDGVIINFSAQGTVEYWQEHFIYVARDMSLGNSMRPGWHDGYARSIWALNLASGEEKPIVRATKDYDYEFDIFSEDRFTYIGKYYSNETLEIRKTKFTSGVYEYSDLVNEFKK